MPNTIKINEEQKNVVVSAMCEYFVSRRKNSAVTVGAYPANVLGFVIEHLQKQDELDNYPLSSDNSCKKLITKLAEEHPLYFKVADGPVRGEKGSVRMIYDNRPPLPASSGKKKLDKVRSFSLLYTPV